MKKNMNYIKRYYGPFVQRKQIYKDNRRKSGIYCWYNIKTNEFYIGRTIDITKRMYCYFSRSYLDREVSKYNSLICKSLLKYNFNSNNFILYILEYCEINFLDLREQYYINTLNPKYNIKKNIDFRAGFKHQKKFC